MSGIGVVVPNADFSKKNFGTVRILTDMSLKRISISGKSIIQGEHYTFEVLCYPSYADQRDVRWSVVSGGEYASIDQLSGELVIDESANGSAVTIRAESVANPEIFNEKSLTVTYEDLEDVLYGFRIIGGMETSGSAQYEIRFDPENTSYKDVRWSISDGQDCASIDQSGVLTVKSEGYVKIRAASESFPDMYTTRIVHVEPKPSDLVYSLPKPFEGDGSSFIDTGFIPNESEEQEWSMIAVVFLGALPIAQACLFSSVVDQSPWNGTGFAVVSPNLTFAASSEDVIVSPTQGIVTNIMIGCSKNKDNEYNIIYSLDGNTFTTVEENVSHNFVQSGLSMLIGARWRDSSKSGYSKFMAKGMKVLHLNIYDSYMTVDSLKDRISKIVNVPEIRSLSYSLPQPFTGNSADRHLYTGIQPLLQNMPFTIVGRMKVPGNLQVTDNPSTTVPVAIVAFSQELSPYHGITVGTHAFNPNLPFYLNFQVGAGIGTHGDYNIKDVPLWFMLCRSAENMYSFYALYENGDETVVAIGENEYYETMLFDLPVAIGASWKSWYEDAGLWRFDNAEVSFLQIYSYVMSKDDFNRIISENR